MRRVGYLVRVSSLSLGTKVFGLVGACLLMLVSVGGFSVWQMARISDELEAIAGNDIPLTRIMTKVTMYHLEQAMFFERAVRASAKLSSNADAEKTFAESSNAYSVMNAKVRHELAEAHNLISSVTMSGENQATGSSYERISRQIDAIAATHADYGVQTLNVMLKIRSGQRDAALSDLPEIEKLTAGLDRDVMDLVLQIEDFTEKSARTAEQHERFAGLLVACLSLAALVLGIATSIIFVRRNISRPLSEIVQGVEALTAGDLSHEVKAYAEDEIGAVARALGSFRSVFAEKKQLEEGRYADTAAAREEAEAALAELASHKLALDLHSIVSVSDRSGRITYVNENFCRSSGYDRNELLGQDHRLLSSGHHPKAFFADLYETLGRGEVWHGEIKNRAKDGSEIWFDTTITPYRDAESNSDQFIAIRTDITELKRAEEGLRTSSQRFKDLAEIGSDWLWECDEEFRFSYFSESFSRITGIPAEKMLGKTRMELTPEPDDVMLEHFRDLKAHRPFRDFRYEIAPTPDRRCHVSVSGTPVIDEDGRFYGYRGTGSDRTAAERMRQQVEHQASIVNLMNTISMSANQSTEVLEALEQCLALVCRFADWPVGHVYVPAADGSGALRPTRCWYLADEQAYARFKQSTEHTLFESGFGVIGLAHAEQRQVWITDVALEPGFPRCDVALGDGLVSAVASPVLVMDQVVAVLEFFSSEPIVQNPELAEVLNHVCTQIGRVLERHHAEAELKTHRDELQGRVDAATADLQVQAEWLKKALDREKELNALQREFVSMASHEFRTPLAIIDSTAQRMISRVNQDRLTPDDALGRIDKIREAVQRMTRLMESTLAAARLQEGRIKIEIAPCSPRTIIDNVCRRQQEIARGHDIRWHCETLPKTIEADEGAMEQVLANLLSNAVKYSPEASEIDVTAGVDGLFIEIAVRDSGIGIDEDELDRLGERFFRAKTSTGIEGTGIGLNLVRTLVEMHGGSLAVESRKGKGSTFSVRFPISGPDGVAADAA